MSRPALVRHWLTVVTVECPECDMNATVQLVGGALAHCPACDAPLACGRFSWDPEVSAVPRILIGRSEKLKLLS